MNLLTTPTGTQPIGLWLPPSHWVLSTFSVSTLYWAPGPSSVSPKPFPPLGCLEVAEQAFAWACPLPEVRQSRIPPAQAQNPARCRAYMLINKCLLTFHDGKQGKEVGLGQTHSIFPVCFAWRQIRFKHPKPNQNNTKPWEFPPFDQIHIPSRGIFSHPEGVSDLTPTLAGDWTKGTICASQFLWWVWISPVLLGSEY